MDKVKELVERVRLTDEELDDSYYNPPTTIMNEFLSIQEQNRCIAEAQLNKVLNDKDIALIVKGFHSSWVDDDGERYDYGKPTRYIPLAEALKEG